MSNAAAVEEVRPGHPEEVHALQEEGPLLGEEGLHRAQVQHGLVYLDLAEIRPDGEIHLGVGVQAPVGIQAGPVVPAPIVIAARRLELPGGPQVGRVLPARPGGQPREAAQVRKPADEAAVSPGHHQPAAGLAHHPLIGPAEVDAPGLGPGALLEAQEREGDLQLRRPAAGVHGHGALPHAVPAGIEGAVVVDDLVLLHPGGVHLEDEGGAPVVAGVDGHPEPVAGAVLVAAMDAAHHMGPAALQPAAVEHPGSHIEVPGVVEDPHLRALAGRPSTLGPLLGEPRGEGRPAPCGVVEAAVQPEGGLDPHGLKPGLRARGSHGQRAEEEDGAAWRAHDPPRSAGSPSLPHHARYDGFRKPSGISRHFH